LVWSRGCPKSGGRGEIKNRSRGNKPRVGGGGVIGTVAKLNL